MNPAYHGTTYDGSGVTIGIVGDSNLSAQAIQDIANFRALFLNDPNGLHAPNIVVDGNDPGENGDEIEALTDIELAEGIAPGANVNFYTSANTDLSQGLMLAVQRALNDNAVNVLNVSFGSCEYYEGASGNAAIAEMWQQAVAQGITVTVSSGDSGSASCDADSETEAQMGLAVNGLASTPYNVAVGGTDFTALFNSAKNLFMIF
jgi:trimeric autotransporter adhesin